MPQAFRPAPLQGEGPSGDQSARSEKKGRRHHYLEWVPIPVFLAALAVFYIGDIQTRFEPPYLLPTLNVLFLTVSTILLAHLSSMSYLSGRSSAALFLGCGMWILGIVSAVAGVLGYFGEDAHAVMVHNCGAFLSGFFILISALSRDAVDDSKADENPAWRLAAFYFGSLGMLILMTVAELEGHLPEFFRPGEGATPLRQVVVIAAGLEFAVSAALFAAMYYREGSKFQRRLSIGLGLIALGLFGVIPQTELGSPINWIARLSQYSGGLYILAAVLSGYRQHRAWGIPLGRSLYELRRRHKALVELCPDAILVHCAGKYVYANPAAAQLFGARSPADLMGKDVLELTDPAFRGQSREHTELAYAGHVTPLREKRFLRFDGRPTDVEVTGAPVEFDGKPAILVVARDITERKRAEAVSARYQLITQHARDPFLLIGLDGRIAEANQAASALYGYTREELLNLNIGDLRRLEDPEIIRTQLQQARQQGLLFESVHISKDGRHIPVEVSSRGVVVEGQEMLLSVIRDVTVRKQSEEALKHSERLYRGIGESIDYGIWVCAPDGRNIYASESFLKLVGMTQERCSDFGWGDVLHPDDADRTIAAWKECVKKGGTWDIEHRFRGVDGLWHDVLARGVPVRDERGEITCWAGINLDISRLKRAEEELRRAKDELDLRVQERTELLSHTVDVLHEEVAQRTIAERSLRERTEQLRQLTAELTRAEQREREHLAQVLHDGLQQILVGAKFRLAAILRSHDREIQKSASEVADLIDDAIETSRSLTAELSPQVLREFGLVPALEWLARWMQDKQGLSMTLKAQAHVDPLEDEVKVLLFQAARELLFNVVKHASVKTAHVEAIRIDGQVQITVEDEGGGFDPGQLRSAGGRTGGFGLFSIRERLQLLGGRMQIESSPRQGSRITLIAPAGVPASPGSDPHATPAPRISVSVAPVNDGARPDGGKRIRVMLVDDHIVMRQGLTRLLQETSDMEVVGEASDGEAAVRLAREIIPEVILMDIGMPGMNGILATRIIRSELPQIQIIGLSMFEEKDRAAAMISAGAARYLTKSGLSNTIIEAIRECARQSLNSRLTAM